MVRDRERLDATEERLTRRGEQQDARALKLDEAETTHLQNLARELRAQRLISDESRQQAERVEAEALSVERAVGGRDVQLGGVVRVTAVETLASHVLAPCFCALQRRSPEIVIELLAEVRHLSRDGWPVAAGG